MYVLAIDQGTSGTKSIIVDGEGRILAKATEPLTTLYLDHGFVEQDPETIYRNVLSSVEKCFLDFEKKGGNRNDVTSCGISNQRETFVLWDKNGVPLHNAVVWQCKRSIGVCESLSHLEEAIQKKTGLRVDPYFSGTKVIWLYRNNEKIRTVIDRGEAYFGTIDTWLLFKLTGNYFTDYTNASRTLFFNLLTLSWDRELLASFSLSKLNLPEVKPSSFDFGKTGLNDLHITAMIGDSHAAAFGEGCFKPGTAKATLGTGCSILMNVGDAVKDSGHGMVSTICWSTERKVQFAFEGVIVTCGGTIEWLKNEVGLISDSKQTEAMATSVNDNGGVYVIPAFSGLGTPHWDMSRKASIVGLTFASNKNHIVRAALESIAYQIKDVIDAMEKDANIQLDQLMVDGGISSNEFVVQFIADVLKKKVVNLGVADVSALGAAYLAGLKSGLFKDLDLLSRLSTAPKIYQPKNDAGKFYAGWQNAIKLNH
ncbi:MAG: glycerol kinase GlpK [Bacteroidota bacterium]